MAQTSLLHRRQSFDDPNYYGHSSQQSQLICDTHQEGSMLSRQFSNLRQVNSMAQPLVQQYRQEELLHGQQWHRPQALRQPDESAYTGHASHALTYPQSGLQEPDSMYNHGFALNSTLQVPHIMSEPGSFLHQNEFMYPGIASSEFVGKEDPVYRDRLSWFPPRPTELRCGVSVNGSDPDTTSSYSPKSYVSETQGSNMSSFTPELVANAANWGCYSAPIYPSAKVSSPYGIEDAANVGFTGLPRYGVGTTASSPRPVEASQCFNGLQMTYGDTSQYDSEISNSQKNSPGVSPWFSEDQTLTLPATPYRSCDPPDNSAPINSLPIGHQAHIDANSISMSREPAVWNVSRANNPPQERFQDNFHSHEPPDTRKVDDEILLKGKRDGLTYKEISKKMHIKCAESTLRGRYRSLTKARHDRVRKPVWREKDLELLSQFTIQDLDRIDTNHHNSLNYEQRLAKVQWKKIAEAISVSGGSYHFGNSTCKRKWQELHPSP